MAQNTYIARKGEDADFANLTASGTLAVTGAITATAGITTPAVAGVTTVGPLVKLTETVAFGAFTDGAGTSGTYALTVGTIPVGATVLSAAVTAIVGFTGDTSAVLIIGDGSDTDRYNTGTPSVFTTAAGGITVGAPSGVTYHAAAKTVTLTVTGNADFTSITAGSLTVELYYLT